MNRPARCEIAVKQLAGVTFFQRSLQYVSYAMSFVFSELDSQQTAYQDFLRKNGKTLARPINTLHHDGTTTYICIGEKLFYAPDENLSDRVRREQRDHNERFAYVRRISREET